MTESRGHRHRRDPRHRRRDHANCSAPTASHVAAVYAGNHDAAAGAARPAGRGGRRSACTPVTSATRTSAAAWWPSCWSDHGRVDYLVNNAGLLVENNASG